MDFNTIAKNNFIYLNFKLVVANKHKTYRCPHPTVKAHGPLYHQVCK